ncbi:DUF3592 domain-containing protein [Klebsiella aerogenes]|uniref:DUF3592 domain-containing protein n=1 Tax=Klebsiella aerogenes TaxID=548 RepID=UPI0021A834F7|nr:DUF3592 domain-containing protein [Klebsiella aerogenes]MCT1420882.1 DUF3592 domain-containing protein [Klebsiella aerogenes]MCT1500996.1 DUF3592 domain-containing protein [Klebsiella aerogenes]MCT1791021.1 DUF3592 domain-containing protein [Klebsiella aerogenes]MCT2308427.1 DUF3592 domain-containing protein [Klebsiella aerogenes]MCT2317664.1 DUF3592 domain-containing protein [Klebsiella aerogenes]
MDFLNTKWFYILLVACFIAFYIIGRDFRSSVIPMIKAGFIENAVLKTGIAVNADIIVAHQTSMWDGNKPIYHLTLKFKTLEGVETEASVDMGLSFEEIERFKPGNGTTIKYDAKNPKRIVIYDRPLFL